MVRRVWIVLMCRVLMTTGYSISFPYFAIYLNKERGIPMGWIGSFLALSVLGTALSHIAGGYFSDRFGRKRVMLFGMFSRSLLVAAIALAVHGSAPFLALASLHVLNGLLGTVFDPASAAWISDRFARHERIQAYSLVRMGGNLGWAIGPALGGLAAGHAYAELFLGTALVHALCALLVLAWVEAETGRLASSGESLAQEMRALGDPRLLRLCAGVFLIASVMSQIIAPMSLYAVIYNGLKEWQLGTLFSLNGGMVVLFQFALITFLLKRKLTTLLCCGAMLYALGYTGMALADQFGLMALVVAVVTAGEMVTAPSMYTLAANIARPESQGRYIGVVGLAQQSGWALGILLGGWGLGRWGGLKPCPYWFGVGAVACAAAAVFFTLKSRIRLEEEGILVPEAVAAEPVI